MKVILYDVSPAAVRYVIFLQIIVKCNTYQTKRNISSHIWALHLDGLSINGILPADSWTRTEPKGALME